MFKMENTELQIMLRMLRRLEGGDILEIPSDQFPSRAGDVMLTLASSNCKGFYRVTEIQAKGSTYVSIERER